MPMNYFINYLFVAAQYTPALLKMKGFIFVYRLAEDGSLL